MCVEKDTIKIHWIIHWIGLTEKLRFELDKFLELFHDEPKMPNYLTASGSNSILDQLTHLRAQEIYQSGGVPDSAMEQS